MKVDLPDDLEVRVRDVVRLGRFASVEDAIAEAARRLLDDLERERPGATVAPDVSSPGFIGALRDDAELLDQAVEHAMKVREERPWRLPSGE